MASNVIVTGFNRFENALDFGLEKCVTFIDKNSVKKQLQTRFISTSEVYGLALTGVIYHLTLLCFHQIGIGFLKIGEGLSFLCNKDKFVKRALSSSRAKVRDHSQKISKYSNIIKQVPMLLLKPAQALPQLKKLIKPSLVESAGKKTKRC